jgi:uncharacterized membrane protein YbhN (UPF0104 family)
VNDAPAGNPPHRTTGKRSLVQKLTQVPTPVIFIGSVAIAVVLLWVQGSLGDVARAARDADRRLLPAAAILYLISLAWLAGRWHYLVKMVHGTSHAMRAAEAFLTSVVVNYAAPVGVAVPTRAALTKRALGLTTSETGRVALWEVGLDVLVLMVLSGIWVLISGGKALDALDSGPSLLLIAVAIAACIVGAIVLLGLLRRFKPALWARLRIEGRQFIRMPIEQPRESAGVVLISLVYWGAQVAVIWMLLKAVGVDASASFTLGLTSVPILIGMISPVPGGAGVREGLMVAMARVYDVDSVAVLLAALVYRIALFAAIPILYAVVRFELRREHLNPTVSLHELTGHLDDTSTRPEDNP